MRHEDQPRGGEACSIAIFSSRETPEALHATLAGALAAAPSDAVIDLLVNGNRDLSRLLAEHVRSLGLGPGSPIVRVWDIPLRDKAHAWNQHIHHIWRGKGNAFYIDGYVCLKPGAIESLSESLRENGDALGGTGLPSTGKSAKNLRELIAGQGGFHGNFCCLTGYAMEQFRARGIRLPLGIYRTDSTIGSILSFGLDPASHRWDSRRFIAVAQDATWKTDPKRWWRMSDVKATFRRMLRQAQGRLENLAVRDHLSVRKLDPAALPASVHELVLGWIERNRDEAGAILNRDPLMRFALAKLREQKAPTDASASAELVYSGGSPSI
jgi:hypothetical protein